MDLTMEDKLAILYQGESRPAAVASDVPDGGLTSKLQTPSMSIPTNEATTAHRQKPKSLHQRPVHSERKTEQEHTDMQSDSEIEDDYIAACAAKVAPKNISKQILFGRRKRSDSYDKTSSTLAVGKSMLPQSGEHADPKSSFATACDDSENTLATKFCALALIAVFPYKFISKDASDRVAKRFFDQGKIWSYQWEIYYIHLPTYLDSKPILLVPFEQFQDLVDKINQHYNCSIVVPTSAELGFTVQFHDDSTPQPVYLGRGRSRDQIDKMQENIPLPHDGHGVAPTGAGAELERSFELFRQKMETMNAAMKRRNKSTKKKRAQDRVSEQLKWCQSLKRSQRYLGLRPRLTAPSSRSKIDPEISWDLRGQAEQDAAITGGRQVVALDVHQVAPYFFDYQPIIIAFDVESNERNHKQVTEVGVSILDTMDVKDFPPGDSGCNWRAHIRSRHFRIAEHVGHVNREFCPGDPTKFEFGASEIVPVAQVAKVFDECFQWPFSAEFKQFDKVVDMDIQHTPTIEDLIKEEREGVEFGRDHPCLLEDGEIAEPGRDLQKGPRERNIVLVGHDLMNDVQYLRIIGSTILHNDIEGPNGDYIRPTIIDALDTTLMYKVLIRDTQSRSLGNILVDMGICGWHLHNAGNDARYTLEAFIAIAFRQRLNEDKFYSTPQDQKAASEAWKQEIERRVAQKNSQVEEQVRLDAAIWDTVMRRNTNSLNIAVAGDLGISQSENESIAPQESFASAAPTWLLDTGNNYSHQFNNEEDGGEPEGWKVPSEDADSGKTSKARARARRKESEAWYNEHVMKQNHNKMLPEGDLL
ncbi:putative qde-2-interacting protein [Phaeomoniella chlamydospora]|uniref:Putative qde-2-interacting protein n=1 Tax=Phaeomoniella chlamydospora TaxID=158046 RepID=A0A0G2FYN3_PHACM|nr:putative qde-2-interacting protein [Phaeomoniella chlamydospora]